MIVEDEALLALELESELQSAGHQVVGHAMASKDAMNLAAQTMPDFAFVDIHLLDGPSGIDVGRHLHELAIPYVFVTGNLKRIPEDFAGAIGAIEKPYTMSGLQNAVTFLETLVTAENVPISSAPPSLVVAPAFAC